MFHLLLAWANLLENDRVVSDLGHSNVSILLEQIPEKNYLQMDPFNQACQETDRLVYFLYSIHLAPTNGLINLDSFLACVCFDDIYLDQRGKYQSRAPVMD